MNDLLQQVKIPAAEKLKFLFVSKEALIGDLAWNIKKEGHLVKYCIELKTEKDICDGFVEKCEDWKAEKDWADVIIFDDVDFGSIADDLRKQGKFIVGGSSYTDKLELDRDFGQDELQKSGVVVLPHWKFTSFDEAIAFVKKNPDRYVIKPSGSAQDQKELLYIGKEDDGNDVIDVLELYKKSWSKKIKVFQLQRFAKGVEVAVGAFFNGKEFVRPIHVNFEHKKLFAGDIGPNCYSEDTEILTDTGWKKFNEVLYNDKIMSFNASSKKLIWEYPSLIYWKKYIGRMISFKNRYIDLLVTPNHRMLYENRKQRGLRVKEARDLTGENYILQASCYDSIGSIRVFELPEYIDGRKCRHPKKEIPMDIWARFLGWYISEGSCSKQSVRIAQTNSNNFKEIEDILNKLPFNWCKCKTSYKIYSVQLENYLRKLGKNCYEKYVPAYIKNNTLDIIRLFLDAFNLGDGDIHSGQKRYTTSSVKLIDDLQEMLLKIGISSTITRDKRFKLNFSIEERKTDKTSVRKKDKKELEYDGYIGCVTVPSSFIVVRRNGRVAISGNTGEMGTVGFFSDSNELFNETMAKMKDKLATSGYVGYIDLNCIVNTRGIYPLEWTSRFGYPTISLQMEGITGNLGKFFYKLAKGEATDLKVKKGFQICIVIAVPPFPYEDPIAFKRYSEDSVVMFKKQDYSGVHLGEVKLIDGQFTLAGQSGYSLVITASGMTMAEASDEVYKRVRNIILPNMFYRTDIGERWVRDSDLLLSWGYL